MEKRKRNSLLILILVCLFIVNVKADMGAPTVLEHKAMITNKNGAVCYTNDGKKTDKVIPYGTTFKVMDEISGSYIYVNSDDYSCNIKYSDISAVSQEFKLDNNENVYKLKPEIKAVILAKGGLNMRKGPSVTYGKIMTIPEHAVVTLTHKAGSFWYYTTYNGKSGWVTGMDGYMGYDGEEVLIDYNSVSIYSADGKTVLGKIPANTEITNYIVLTGEGYGKFSYYVIYNNIKGYIGRMFYKESEPGKFKLKEDYTIYENSKPSKKITKGQEFEYTMEKEYPNSISFYVPEKNMTFDFGFGDYETVKEAKPLVKKSGYIGEGLFGEAKEEKQEETVEPSKDENKKEEQKQDNKQSGGMSTKEIIIICLLAGIFLALTALVIIKLINGKKNKKPPVVVNNNPVKSEIDIARETIEKRVNSEPAPIPEPPKQEETINNENKEV